MTLEITIPGRPFAKQRHGFNTKTGRAYTPKATVSFERTVAEYALAAGAEALSGPVRVFVYAQFLPPASWSKKKRFKHINRPHTQRPDLDNIVKAALDGLNRVAFADDAQVAAIEVRKVWGPEAKTVIEVTPLT